MDRRRSRSSPAAGPERPEPHTPGPAQGSGPAQGPGPAPEPTAPAGPAGIWARHGRVISLLGVAYLAIAAIGRLTYALPHLVHDVEPWSAIDLKYRFNEVAEWFAGNPVYGFVDGAVYPPASHAILWPFMGWLSLEGARLIWAITALAAAAAIGMLAYRLCAPAAPRIRLLVAGLAFAAYPLQLSLFTGQLGMHLTAAVALGAFLLFRKGRPEWGTDALAGALFAISLVKPTLSVPLVACALLAARRARPAILVALSYGALTLIAVAAQPAGLFALLRDWLEVAGYRVTIEGGVPNLHHLLGWGGLRSWMAPSSLLILTAMALWMWRRRNVDPWVLMGVSAVVARFWAHSTLYDDGFLLLAAVALFRILSGASGSFRVPGIAGAAGNSGVVQVPRASAAPGVARALGTAGAFLSIHRFAQGLLVAAWATLLTPTWFFYDFPPRLVRAVHGGQAVLWLGVLSLLVTFVHRQFRSRRTLSHGIEESDHPPQPSALRRMVST